jgi:hypothetical protein
MAKVLEVIWGKWEQKYFSENQKKDSTDGQITGGLPRVFPHAFFKNLVRSTGPLTLSVRPSISSALSVR